MKKVIPIILLCIASLLCLAGCTINYKEKAQNVDYFESGVVGLITIKFELKKNIGNNGEFIFEGAYSTKDYLNCFPEKYKAALYNENEVKINFDDNLNSVYDKTDNWKLYIDVKELRNKGDYLIIDIEPIYEKENDIIKNPMKKGKFEIFLLDDIVAYKEHFIKAEKEFGNAENLMENESFRKQLEDYLKKHTTKYTFTF